MTRTRNPEICCFYEIHSVNNDVGVVCRTSEPQTTVTRRISNPDQQLVPENAATIHGCEARPMLKDHFGLIEHASHFDSQYRTIYDRLQTMIGGTSGLLIEYNRLAATVLRGHRSSSPDGREKVLDSLTISEEQRKTTRYALALDDQGHFQAAEKAFGIILEAMSEPLQSDVAVGAFVCTKLSSTLRESGRHEDAKYVCESLLRKTKTNRVDNSTNPKAIQGLANLIHAEQTPLTRSMTLDLVGSFALILRDQENNSKTAAQLLTDNLETSPEALQQTPLRISLFSILAQLYKDIGYYDLAELLSRDVLLSSIREFGLEDPFTLCRGSDLSILLCRQGKLSLAEEFCTMTLNLLEKSLGRHHQDSLKASQRLAYIKLFQSEYAEACQRFEDVLTLQKKRLHPHHRRMLTTMSGLGVCYVFLDRFRAGETLLRRAYNGQVNELGKLHADTIWTKDIMDIIGVEKKKLRLTSETEMDIDSFQDNLVKKLRNFLDLSTRHEHTMAPPRSSNHSKFLAPQCEETQWDLKLRIAALKGDDEGLLDALKHHGDPKSIGGVCGSALHVASFSGSREAIRMLLAKGADVNAEGGIFGTPIRAAAFAGHYDIVSQLIKAGADLNKTRSPETSAFRAALSMGHEDIVKLLVTHGADKYVDDNLYGTALHEAAMEGKKNMVKLLLNERMDPNVHAGVFRTPIEASAWGGDTDTAKLLLRRGSSFDERLEGGRAIHLAENRGHRNMITLLRKESTRLMHSRNMSRRMFLTTPPALLEEHSSLSSRSEIPRPTPTKEEASYGAQTPPPNKRQHVKAKIKVISAKFRFH